MATALSKKQGQIAPASHSSRRLQHILNENPIPARRVVDKHVRHRANQPAVLKDGAAAHALHDAAGLFQQLRVRHADDHAALGKTRLARYFHNLHSVFPHAGCIHRAQDGRRALVHGAAAADGQAVRVEGVRGRGGHAAVDAVGAVAREGAQHAVFAQEAALQLARIALLALAHVHHIRRHDLALSNGQDLLRVRIGDGVAQRAVHRALAGLDLAVEGQRAYTGGGIAHPGADAEIAALAVAARLQGEQQPFFAAQNGQGQRRALIGRHLLGQIVGAGHGLTIRLGDDVAGLDARHARRAERAAEIAGAHHQHALGAHGHAHGLSARVEAQIVGNLHPHLADGQKAEQADGGRGRAQLFIGGGAGRHGQFTRIGQGEIRRLRARYAEGVGQGAQKLRLRRKPDRQHQQAQQPAGQPAFAG